MSPGEFLKEFGHLAETEGGIERLRTLVLAQAFQGHLGGAEAPRKRLIDVSEIEMGNSPPGTSYNDAGNGVPLINGPVEFSPGPFGETRRTKFTTEPTRMCKTGDILICVRGATTGRTNIAAFDACIGRGVASIRPTGEPRYVHWFLVYSAKRLLAAGTGTTFPAISRDQIDTLELPIPPLPEQKRIVEKVDQLMALCDELEAKQKQKRTKAVVLNKAALSAVVHAPSKSQLKGAWSRVQDHFEVLYELPENVKELRQTILQLAVMGKLVRQDPKDEDVDTLLTRVERERREAIAGRRRGGRGSGTSCEAVFERSIPKSWRKCSLGDLADHIVDGTHHTPKYVDKGMDFISAKDIRRGEISFEGCRQISKDEYDALTLRCAPKRGNVLITKSGSIGEVAIVEVDRPFTLFESVALVPVLPSMNARYVALVMQLEGGGKFAQEKRRGVGVPHLHLVDLRTMPVPVPPLAEQERIVTKVRRLMDLCGDLEAKLGQHRGQGQRLMQAVVEGLVG